MKFETLKNYLKESFVSSFRTVDFDDVANLYKNEEISNLSNDVRGVITAFGDIYCAEIASTKNAFSTVIHEDILVELKRRGIVDFRGDPGDAYEKFDTFINVQRDGKTSNFYLGESYSNGAVTAMKSSKTVEGILKKFKSKNPSKIMILKSMRKV